MDQQIIRDFSSVSPSARWMILLKGYTTVPYAREVAELLEHPDPYIPDFGRRDFTFWASTLGLEARYRSIDQLLNDLPVNNILELSSGFSFRSLDLIRNRNVHYIDTDLPEIIAVKKQLAANLKTEESVNKGTVELIPLNVLDVAAFKELPVVSLPEKLQ